MKTFADIISEGYTYPDIIPDDLQAVIYDWYKYRNVCDDEKFGDFFTRLLYRDYNQYDQLLRIEAGVSQYDWLVTKYHELQRQTTGTETSTGETTKQSENGQTVNDNILYTDIKTRGVSSQGSDTDSENKTVTIDGDEHTITDIDTETTDNIDTTIDRTNSTDTKTMAKDTPMSIEYAGATGIPSALDWRTASAQGEESQTGTSQDVTDTDRTITGTDDRDVRKTTDRTDETTRTASGTDAHGETESVSNIRTGENGRTIAGTGSETDTVTGETENEATIREIMTGHDGQIANILERAKQYIITTNAWEWLAGQIDTVFMGVYDV